MSSTRKAQTDSPPRQERFMSSPEFDPGLMANMVSRRCCVLKSARDKELIYWLQYHSHMQGGLKQLADDLITHFRDRIVTREMLELGCNPNGNYSPEQALTIQMQIPDSAHCFIYEAPNPFGPAEESWDVVLDRPKRRAPDSRPKSYRVKEFVDFCEAQAGKNLESYLEELCLNPQIKLEGGPWYFPALIESLFEYQAELAAQERQSFVFTELAKLVYETLEYSLHGKCLTLIDGRARTGKTFTGKKWVACRPGRARFVEIPAGNSDIGFFRAIAEALGVSTNLNSKAHQLRDRIECVLRTGDLMLVLDESQNCWPDSLNREALPFRVSWIMAMVNAGIPISLIVTNQFFHAQKRTERRSGWTSEQFVGRIAFYQPLPEALSDEDLRAVAKAFLPEADKDSITKLALLAKASEKYLAGIEFTVKRARYLASKSGREKVLVSDLKRAIAEGVIPSDKLLAEALAKPEKTNSRNRRAFVAARELPTPEPLMPAKIRQTEPSGPMPVRETSLVIESAI